jgi:protein TonB
MASSTPDVASPAPDPAQASAEPQRDASAEPKRDAPAGTATTGTGPALTELTAPAATAPGLPSGEAANAAAAALPANDAVDAGRLVLVKSVQPDYPREARQSAIEGWVELEFTVAASGRVQDLSVRAASPRGVFDQAARNALSQWRYKPVLVDSKPVPQRARIRIRFALAR